MKRFFLELADRSSSFKRWINRISHLKGNWFQPQEFPPGHFYSPIPSLAYIKRHESTIFNIPRLLPSIDLNEAEQIRLLDRFKAYYDDLPFKPEREEGLRYYFENDYYSYSDAIFLYAMIRHLKPRNIIEIGSGFSSCLLLDTNELHFNNEIRCTFIEPFPERLLSLIKKTDIERIELIRNDVQQVDAATFGALSANDMLLIDSTHSSKAGSDVNYILFEILPALNKGVFIHFHDIFFPFEYPKKWIFGGRSWNEAYLLRAFLQYNHSFKIMFFNSYMEHFFKNKFEKEYPLCLRNSGGSIWVKKC